MIDNDKMNIYRMIEIYSIEKNVGETYHDRMIVEYIILFTVFASIV